MHEPRDPRCNKQLKTSFTNLKDSFIYPVPQCAPHIYCHKSSTFDYPLSLLGLVWLSWRCEFYPNFTKNGPVPKCSSKFRAQNRIVIEIQTFWVFYPRKIISWTTGPRHYEIDIPYCTKIKCGNIKVCSKFVISEMRCSKLFI